MIRWSCLVVCEGAAGDECLNRKREREVHADLGKELPFYLFWSPYLPRHFLSPSSSAVGFSYLLPISSLPFSSSASSKSHLSCDNLIVSFLPFSIFIFSLDCSHQLEIRYYSSDMSFLLHASLFLLILPVSVPSLGEILSC